MQVAQLEEEKRHLDFMASMRQYDPDPSTEDENAKDRPKDDPVVDLFPDDDADDRNSKCKRIFLPLNDRNSKISNIYTFIKIITY